MSEYIIPQYLCDHPTRSLGGLWQPDQAGGAHQLSLVCTDCGSAWDQDTVPLDVLERVVESMSSPKFAHPMRLRPR